VGGGKLGVMFSGTSNPVGSYSTRNIVIIMGAANGMIFAMVLCVCLKFCLFLSSLLRGIRLAMPFTADEDPLSLRSPN
jgi:hypothetical protein